MELKGAINTRSRVKSNFPKNSTENDEKKYKTQQQKMSVS